MTGAFEHCRAPSKPAGDSGGNGCVRGQERIEEVDWAAKRQPAQTYQHRIQRGVERGQSVGCANVLLSSTHFRIQNTTATATLKLWSSSFLFPPLYIPPRAHSLQYCTWQVRLFTPDKVKYANQLFGAAEVFQYFYARCWLVLRESLEGIEIRCTRAPCTSRACVVPYLENVFRRRSITAPQA